MTNKVIRWGIIGCGDVTEVKSGPGFQKARHSELVAVMRRDGTLAKDYAVRHNVPKCYDDAQALILDKEVDAVYIATPPAFHKEYAIAVAKAKKPVYVEKPMAKNYSECVDMVKACQDAGVPLFVAYYRRALPRFLKIKELLMNGAIGDIRFVTTTHYFPLQATQEEKLPWRLQPRISGGGLFIDLASHTLDILDFLLGPITNVKGFASNHKGHYEAEDIVTGAYQFESGIHGMGTWCFSAFSKVDENKIVGSKGSLVFSTFGHEPIRLITEQGKEEIAFTPPQHIQQPLIQTIVDELLGIGICSSTGITGSRASFVMDEMVSHYYKGKN